MWHNLNISLHCKFSVFRTCIQKWEIHTEIYLETSKNTVACVCLCKYVNNNFVVFCTRVRLFLCGTAASDGVTWLNVEDLEKATCQETSDVLSQGHVPLQFFSTFFWVLCVSPVSALLPIPHNHCAAPGRSRASLSMGSLIDLILPTALWPCGRLSF
jgi:hypothetical protein